MDTVTKEKRSAIMAAVRSNDSKIEAKFRRALWTEGYRYRKNVPGYPGKPDILLKKYNVVVFIDSCFWHGCKQHLRMPSSKRGYWKNKIRKNIARDKEVNKHYNKSSGWRIIRIWEHDISKNFDKKIKEVTNKLK